MSLQMETLSNNFNNLLTQYQEVYQDFLNTINSSDNNLTSVPNSAFVGQNNINTIQGSSVDSCLSSCSSTQSCTGATFNNRSNTCTLSSGTGNIINSTNQTAIVQQALYYSNQLQKINDNLMQINNQMMNLANSNSNSYSQTEQEINNKFQILNQNYEILQEERLQINEMANQYETLNSALENGNITLTSNYYYYMLYLIIAIFLIYLLFKYNLPGEQVGGGFGRNSYLLYLFLAIVIIFNAYLKN
jgi:hypothetical protein